MSKINVKVKAAPIFTHEGAKAVRINAEAQLRRSILSCFLWENEFYEDGKTIADRILETAGKVDKITVGQLAVEARTSGLRHAPLLLLLDLVKKGGTGVADFITNTIQRPDEITELLALYWKFNPNKDLSAQLKKGIAGAFEKFNEYSLAKYNQDGQVKLRDALFLSHVKPANAEREALYKRLANNELVTPDTWEVALSAGKDKGETFTRLIQEGKLGYMALLRNLRNMVQAGVDPDIVKEAIVARKGSQYVLPFRYTAAARIVPQFEKAIDQALIASISEREKFDGKTIVLVDVSGSMDARLSAKSDMRRVDAAATLASVIDGDVRVFTFSTKTVEVPHRLGMAGVDAIVKSQPHGGTYLGQAVEQINKIPHDRLIVITDEQSASPVPNPVAKNAYMINVASNRNGIGYGKWTHIDGFSEGVIKFILESERDMANTADKVVENVANRLETGDYDIVD